MPPSSASARTPASVAAPSGLAYMPARRARSFCASAIADSQRDLARLAGLYASPEGAAALAGARALVDEGGIERGETVVVFQTGSQFPYS